MKLMNKKKITAITPTRAENYAQWYLEVIHNAEMAENSPVRGCMVIKPWGFALWENIQAILNSELKATGHENAYFPLLIPLSFMEQEAAHIKGFAKECAVITHHRLEENQGKLNPASPLEEPYIIRPSSETIVGIHFAKWIHSYRDLPLLINQWANVVRWEMRTRLFLRTSEFLWQEGHTAHASAEEARTETLTILHLYQKFIEDTLAIPVYIGEKTPDERFPGAETTYTLEAMMQDKKALQAGTSHFLGQNFSRSFNITFSNEEGKQIHAWTTSWGVSTRLIGGLIMTHSDDNGLVLPPKIAPVCVVILPIYKTATDHQVILDYCKKLQEELNTQLIKNTNTKITVKIDDRCLRGGDKKWQHIKKGVPLIIEIGKRDIEKNQLLIIQRFNLEKKSFAYPKFIQECSTMLDQIQTQMLQKALTFQQENTFTANSFLEFTKIFKHQQETTQLAPGFVKCYSSLSTKINEKIKPLQVTARCIINTNKNNLGVCIFTGEKTPHQVLYAKTY